MIYLFYDHWQIILLGGSTLKMSHKMSNHYFVLHVYNIASFCMVCQVDIEVFWCIYAVTFLMYYGKTIIIFWKKLITIELKNILKIMQPMFSLLNNEFLKGLKMVWRWHI
jgi:hypothetical protein